MGQPNGFLEIPRREEPKRKPEERLGHFNEFLAVPERQTLWEQSARCMNCGVPFCHAVGCPLGNEIPDIHEALFRGREREALTRMHLTNNFPEFTGRLCPAPCEAACVNALGASNASAVTIRQIELAVVERGWLEGWIEPAPPEVETGKRVAVIGSGPAGLAAAQQLRRAGHAVTVFERSDRAGGLLRYGIPDFKLEKRFLERRLQQLETEGIRFELSVDVGTDVSAAYFLKKFAAVALCIGSGVPRDLNIPGRNSAGIHFALDYLIQSNRRQAGLPIATDQEISAAGKRVVVIGGGDTGADCLGTALRQGATGVEQLEVLPRPPEGQNPDTPWPKWPAILRNGSSHEEGGQRWWSIETTAFLSAQGRVAGLRCRRLNWSKEAKTGRLKPTPAGEDFELGADLVLLAMGFVHPQREGLLNGLGVVCDARGNVKTDETMMTAVPGVFAAGDAQTGAWLVAGAIAGGRRMARQMDLFLMGESALLDCPAPPNL